MPVLFLHDLCHDAHGDLSRHLSSDGKSDGGMDLIQLFLRKALF